MSTAADRSDYYPLSPDDARLLFELACVTEDRSDEEQAALARLADWLDDIEGDPGTVHVVDETGVASFPRPTFRDDAENTRES